MLAALGGAALVATLWLTWVSVGNGSTLPGHRLSSALRSTVDEGWARAAGVGVVVLALGGCAAVGTCWRHGPVAAWCRVGLGIAVLVVLGALVGWGAFPLSRWDLGPMAALAGSAMLVSAGTLNLVARRAEDAP